MTRIDNQPHNVISQCWLVKNITREFQNGYDPCDSYIFQVGTDAKNMAFTETYSIVSYFHVLNTVSSKKLQTKMN